jgi:chemotaxis receptor (MCP) glutamine deamidase CheD
MTDVKKTTIHIGGVFASREPSEVHTVLGSCVSACLFDASTRIGGMNHFMLPDGSSGDGTPTRFGVHAMELLINRIMRLGGDRRLLQAKVFGGAQLLGISGIPVGTDNARFVREFLETEQIPIIAHRLGGYHPLAVHFFTATSRVLVRPLGDSRLELLAKREQQFRSRLIHRIEAKPAGEDITLF